MFRALLTCLVAGRLSGACATTHDRDLDGGRLLPDGICYAPSDSTEPRVTATVTVTDSTGWAVTFSYAMSCAHRPMSEATLPHPIVCTDPARPRSEGVVDWNGRVLLIQARCSSRIYEIQPRPVVCVADADCTPVLPYLDTFFDAPEIPTRVECIRGLCQLPDQPIIAKDVYALCLSDTPRWRDFETSRSPESGYLELRERVSDACRSGTCVVPLDCRQP